MIVRILIADDHKIVREGLKHMMKFQSELQCLAEAASGEEVLKELAHNEFDLLLLDMTMEGLSGPQLVKQIRALHPSLPILVLSMHNVTQLAIHAIRAGANGYITKDSDPEKLFAAIKKVANGGKYLDPHLAEEMLDNFSRRDDLPHQQLSGREFEIFRLLANGKSNQEIAQILFISVKTVSTHKARVLEKMQLSSVTDLVRYALENKILG
jgi:DNA-binding NarL/FixJ family response regulator